MAPGTPDPEPGQLFPMAFLVEQDPGSTASAHYHQADQFQLVVAGPGTMGTHEAAPVTVHFAAPTPPMVRSGPARRGVSYFTLRNGFDPGARFMTMPENRAALRAVPGRRHREAVVGPLAHHNGRHRWAGPGRDGRLAVPAAAGDRLIGPDPAWGPGRTGWWSRGSMINEGQTIPKYVLRLRLSRGRAVHAFAGPDGADVIAMQFPRA